VSEDTELVVEAPCEAAQEPANENGNLSEKQFNQLTEKLIFTATANGVLPSDALAALAKALGTLSAFTARREGLNVEEVLAASQESVANFAAAAEIYMKENAEVDPYRP
jgi:hypothetical protein